MTTPAPERVVPDRVSLVDIEVPLPELWISNEIDDEGRAATEAELVEMFTGQVDDPETLAAEAYDEFMERIGGGAKPMLVASFREELSDESVLSASLMVAKNELTGSLDQWKTAYADAIEMTVADAPAIRTEEETVLPAGALFLEDVTMVTYRYIVEFDRRSTLLFTFTTPNAELRELLVAHFDEIMTRVTIEASRSGDDAAADASDG